MATKANKTRKTTTHRTGKSHAANTHGRKRWLPNRDLRKVTRERASDLALNLVGFNKAAFDGTAKLVTSVQEKTEDRFVKVLADASWMPKEGRKVIMEWIRMMRRGRSDFRKTVDASFDLVHDYIERVGTAEAKNGKPHTVSAPARKPRKATRARALAEKAVAA